jgi:hypothetical protein
MNPVMVSRITGIAGILTLVASEILLFNKIEPVYTWFYSFAWWSYICIVDSVVFYKRGTSLIVSRTKEFLLMIPWSAAWWLFFELANLNLKNWHYVNLPSDQWFRWAGYFIAYATVLPGIFETKELLASFGVMRIVRVSPARVTKTWHTRFLFIGISFLLLPLFLPKYFFPLVWGCFIFLLEPFLYRMRGESLLRQWELGSMKNFALFLLAGFLCGGLWEFWNFWSYAKWIYTVPWVGNLKIFEMPVLGFFGFPPFAVMSYVMWNMITALYNRRLMPPAIFLIPLFVIYYYFCFLAIDTFTVHTFQIAAH